MTSTGPRTVTVSVVVTESVTAAGAIARVLVEDVSRADAPATIVAEVTRPLTDGIDAGERFTVELSVPEVDDRTTYNVHAHVALSGSGQLSSGDRITTRSYPVLTRGAPDRVDVEVVPI